MINSHKYILIFLSFINLSLTSNASQLEESFSEERRTNSNLIDQAGSEDLYKSGKKYFEGLEVKKDHQKAVSFFYDAAQQGHLKAQHDLAWMYEHGCDGAYNYGCNIPKDESKAIYWYQTAASQGCKDSQRDLGKFLYKSYEYSHTDDAFYWLGLAAEQNDPEAQLELGLMWRCEHTKKRSSSPMENAYKLFSDSAQQGNAKAMCYQGIMKIMGDGTPKDEIVGARLCLRSSENCIEGQFCTALLYLKGIGIDQDTRQSLGIFRDLANKNFPLAYYALMNIYDKGMGVEADSEKSSSWSRIIPYTLDEPDEILSNFYYQNIL